MVFCSTKNVTGAVAASDHFVYCACVVVRSSRCLLQLLRNDWQGTKQREKVIRGIIARRRESLGTRLFRNVIGKCPR